MEVLYYLLATYATKDVIAEPVGDISSSRQGQGTTAADIVQSLYDKVLRCGNVFQKSQSNVLFVEGLIESVSRNKRVYWERNSPVALFQLAQYEETIFKWNRPQMLM